MKHIIILIDSSYSMYKNMENVVNRLNIFINDIRDRDLYITIARFSHFLHYVIKFQNVNFVPTFRSCDFNTCGSTALYDAIYEVISEFLPTKSIKHNLFIISDGEDTCSKHGQDETNNLCEQALKGGWKIIHCNTDVSKLSVPTLVFNIDNEKDISNLFDRLKV